MVWAWRTLNDGRVEVDRNDGNGYQALGLNLVSGVVEAAKRTMQWEQLAREKAAKYGIPVSWLLAFTFAESGGDDKAENYCCAGLMAIYWKVHGKSRQDMLDAEKNMDYGASLLQMSAEKGYELPGVASIHVAGGGTKNEPHKSPSSPYGMAEHSWGPNAQGDGSQGYIDRVVRANNMFVDILEGRLDIGAPPVAPGPAPPPPPVEPGRGTDAGSPRRQQAAFGVGLALGLGAMVFGPRIKERWG